MLPRLDWAALARVCLIVNPASGGGRPVAVARELADRFAGIEVIETTVARDGERLAREAAMSCERVVAVGGDGTVNEVATGLLGTDAVLGVVPCGTANDYARTFGLPTDPAEALRIAIEGTPRTVDAGQAVGHRAFFNIAGVGFDAEVQTAFDRQGRLARSAGALARYYLAIASTFARYRPTDATLVLDGGELKAPGLLLAAVGVTRFYGSGMMVLPEADPSDGLLDVVWGEDVRLGELGKLMGLIKTGGHLGHPKVRSGRAKTVEVRPASAAAFHLDGDVAGAAPVRFESLPGALRLAVSSPS
jgi:diacylglycerol kinase (ATP)